MPNLISKLLKKAADKVFKRSSVVKKSLGAGSKVIAGERAVAATAERALLPPGRKQLTKLGESGLVKVSKSEVAAYRRAEKSIFTKVAPGAAKRTIAGNPFVKTEVASSSRFWAKAKPFMKWGGEIIGTTALFMGIDKLIDYVSDDDTHEGEEEQKAEAKALADSKIATLTKVGVLQDLFDGSSSSRRRRDNESGDAYYEGSELTTQSYLIQRLLSDLSLSATGDVSSQLDVATLTSMSTYERAELIARLSNIMKAIANNSNAPEVFLLLIRQNICSSYDATGWTEGFERLVKTDAIEDTAVQSIAAEFNSLYEGLYQEQRIDIADTYFNDVTKIVNFGNKTEDFIEGEASAGGQIAKLRMGLASMVIDDSYANVQGWFDNWRVDKDDPSDDEYLAAQEMIRYSTLGSDYIAAYNAAINNDSYRRRNILSK